MKKGIYRPLSDFNFEFLMKVKATKSCSTGFMIKVTLEHISSNDQNNRRQQDEISPWYLFYFGYIAIYVHEYRNLLINLELTSYF